MAAGTWPASRGRIFAGGAGGTARLMQSLPLRLTSGQPVKKAADYRLSATVTPVNLASRKAGKAIPVGADPAAVAVTPDGRTVYVANEGSARSPPSTPPPAGRGGR